MAQIKWYSIVERVNIETGEIIPKYLYETTKKEWRIIGREEKTEFKDGYGIKTITCLIKNHEQLKIEL